MAKNLYILECIAVISKARDKEGRAVAGVITDWKVGSLAKMRGKAVLWIVSHRNCDWLTRIRCEDGFLETLASGDTDALEIQMDSIFSQRAEWV